jgi:hypothetical protein
VEIEPDVSNVLFSSSNKFLNNTLEFSTDLQLGSLLIN